MSDTHHPTLSVQDSESAVWIVPLARVTSRDRAGVGGKAANLGEMLQVGLPVPGGFCVTTAAFRLWLDNHGTTSSLLDALAQLAPQQTQEIREAAASLRQALVAVAPPTPVAQAIRAMACQHEPDTAWAVRSSATAEDLPETSFAGQHDSLLNVRGPEALLAAVRQCWLSLFTERAVAYRLKSRFPHHTAAMAVIVQQMVPAEVSGVMFTADPLTGDVRRIAIEAVYGLGETLVSGKINPDRFVIEKETLRLLERTVNSKTVETVANDAGGVEERCITGARQNEPCLNDALARRLGELGRDTERLFGGPQDIEWAARGGEVFLLQSRPITALPRRGENPQTQQTQGRPEPAPAHEPPLRNGRDAFHRVPNFSRKDGDAVERVPTRFKGTRRAKSSGAPHPSFGQPLPLRGEGGGNKETFCEPRLSSQPQAHEEAEPEIWTNANVMEALPDVVTPMAWSLMQILLNDFLHPLMRRIGLDTGRRPLIGLIAGRAYLNIRSVFALVQKVAGPIQVDVAATFGGQHSSLDQIIPPDVFRSRTSWDFRSLGRLVKLGVWLLPGLFQQQRLLDRWGQRVFGDLAHTSPASLSDQQLADHPLALLRLATLGEGDRTWAAAVWMAVGGVGGSTLLFRFAREWLSEIDDSLANRLLAGASGMNSAENGLELLRLAAWAREHPELKQALLEPISFAAVENEFVHVPNGREFLARWRTFMDQHGHQARGGMDIYQPRWSEMPDFVLDMLRVYLRFNETSDPLVAQARQKREREALWTDCRQRLRNPLKRWLLTSLVRISRRGLAQRENVKNEGVRMVAILRRTAFESGRRLVDRGVLRERTDVFFLRLEELGPVLRNEAVFDVAAVIARRKEEYARCQLLSPPPVIVESLHNSKIAPRDHEPSGRGQPVPVPWGRAVPTPRFMESYDLDVCAPGEPDTQTRTLKGVAVSPGVVTGKARIILQADAAERLQPGEILVAPYTDPGWTPYFLAAAGIVVDVGGLLSHGSVVAREYGLPAVVNVGSATRLIKTGQSIRVDGNRGVVTILD